MVGGWVGSLLKLIFTPGGNFLRGDVSLVRVERRDAHGQFGTQDAKDREAMRLSQFLDLVESPHGAAHYLSTQSLAEDSDGATRRWVSQLNYKGGSGRI